MSYPHGASPEVDWRGTLARLEEILNLNLDGRSYIRDKDIQITYGEAIEYIVANARLHSQKQPCLAMLLEEMSELALALEGKHEHPPEYELIQIGGIILNWLNKIK